MCLPDKLKKCYLELKFKSLKEFKIREGEGQKVYISTSSVIMSKMRDAPLCHIGQFCHDFVFKLSLYLNYCRIHVLLRSLL